jgi:uncharacterized protein YegP (UPF0339 family)
VFGCEHRSPQTTPISEFRAPINSSFQNTPRYQFSLKSETIDNLTILLAAILKMVVSEKWSWMQISSLPTNSSLQNNSRYQFSLKSENIEILPILSAAILKIKKWPWRQISSLPTNSSLQNNSRYQFSLKLENVEILLILSVTIFKIPRPECTSWDGDPPSCEG